MHPAMVKRQVAIAAVSSLLAPAVPHDEVSAADDGDVFFISDNRHRMPAVGIDGTHSDMSPARATVQCGSCECLCGFCRQEQRIPTRKQGQRVVDVDGVDGMAHPVDQIITFMKVIKNLTYMQDSGDVTRHMSRCVFAVSCFRDATIKLRRSESLPPNPLGARQMFL